MTSPGESNILLAVGWAVFNSLWQMAILWVAYQFITTAFKINKSSQRGFLSAILLFAGFLWFAFTLTTSLISNDAGMQAYTALLNLDGNTELGTWLSTMLPIASILYLVLLILPILNFIRNYRYVQVIRRYGLSRAAVEWRMFVQKTSARMGIHKPVHIWMSDLITSPVTIGYIKPVILLPIAAINHLTTHQIEAVLLHELAHIKRYDYFVNLLTKFIQTILYFNPFVKAFAKIIEREREKSCDETVMQFQYEPHGYASALLVLEKTAHIPQHSLVVAASDGKKGEFVQRIEWILGIRKKQAFSYNKLAGVLGALLLFIALNALVIVSKPGKMATSEHSFSFMGTPFEFSAGDGEKKQAPVVAEVHDAPVINLPLEAITDAIEQEHTRQTQHDSHKEEREPVEASPFQFVYDLQTYIPQLTPAEEKQVQEVLAECKKVIEEIKWKETEKAIADALTSTEKQSVKAQIKNAIASVNTKEIEEKMRMVYDKIDWDRVNIELKNELAVIKMDSLQQAYSAALSELSDLQKTLVKIDECGIPDTDITIQSIEEKKGEYKRAINRIKTVRPKKIIRL